MRNLDDLFTALARSRFRSKFRLGPAEIKDLHRHGLAAILGHAAGFIDERLSPAEPEKDGRQTPWRGHPVFIAQHATATCCRGCLAKWHGIPAGVELNQEQKAHVLKVLERWLRSHERVSEPPEPSLFSPLPPEVG
jgi:predicted Fe-S protein YdhL (DUF1289 family)